MKKKSLSQEFYTNLYNEILKESKNADFNEDDCRCYIELEDFEGLYVSLTAIFDIEFVDDSFDHAFGTEYACHYEVGALTDIEDLFLSDEDGNDLSDLFAEDKFWDQFNQYGCKAYGVEVKPGDEVMCRLGSRWSKVTYKHTDTQTGEHHVSWEGSSRISKSIMALSTYNRIYSK